MNIPRRNSITSRSIAASASGTEICSVTSTASAPPSMICQILRRNRPTCRTAIRPNTTKSTTTGTLSSIPRVKRQGR